MKSSVRRTPNASRAEGRESAAATSGMMIGAYRKESMSTPLVPKWRITEKIRLIEAVRK